jgi:protein kinase A
MPTFGGLLKKKKTKESDDKPPQQNAGGYQPIQYKASHKTDTSSPSSKATAASDAPSQSTAATTLVTTTSTPDPNAKSTESNGGVNMNSAPVASTAGGVVDSKPVQRQTKGKYTLTDFKIERTLGTGSFGRVHLVQSKHNQRFYAVKVLKKAQVVKMKQIEHTNDERKMLQRVKHPFLITLWGTFQDSKNLYMVMDFIEGGELFSLLRKSQVIYGPPCSLHCDLSLTPTSDFRTPLRNSTPQKSRWLSSTFMAKTSSIVI